jgi:uncharacterized membrane protein YedE/YeeE
MVSLSEAADRLSPRPFAAAGDRRVVVVSGALLALGAALLWEAVSWRQAALFGIGGALGLVLYHASFGFTSAWRVFISDRRGAGLRAQMVMLALAVLLFFPTLSLGTLFGQKLTGLVNPAGVSVLVGAFLFGLGMQLGGGCASGTLFTVGGGNARMVVTLLFFVVGSTIGAYHFEWWQELPTLGPVSLIDRLGLGTALLLHLALFAAIAGGTWWLERRRHGEAAPIGGAGSWFGGPWPLVWGALALALLNFATLLLSGRPWGITSAFALWGSKAAATVGYDPAFWGYWLPPGRAAELEAPVWQDVTTVMDVGIVLGALLAAGLAGKFAPVWRIPPRSLAAAVIGGLLLGYGARLAYGCNIGAYFSGIASASLHGWLWLAAAFVGNVLGTCLRPLFGLGVERTARPTGC